MLGIVISRADEASTHIRDHLLDVGEWTAEDDPTRTDSNGGGTVYRTPGAELREFDGLHIELEGAAEPFDGVDLLVFASRHAGETGPLLTAHHTGNIGPADYGGDPDRLAMAAPGAIRAVLASLTEYAPPDYDVGLECTHHGPTDIDIPSLFLEVGSQQTHWRDPAAAAATARALLELRGVGPAGERTFVGFGGGHYAPRFARIVRETDWAVGHIVADWSLEAAGELDPSLLRACFERSSASLACIDGDRPNLADRIEALGFRVTGETWLRETTGIDLAVVQRAEAALSSIEDGLRFGKAARRNVADDFQIVNPPAALLETVNGIDPDRVKSVVADWAVAYETTEAGNRVRGRLAVASDSAWAEVEKALIELLNERYADVAVSEEAIVVHDRVFDPDRARTLGVEPGPAFGRLAEGEPVEIDGTTIDPEAVHVTRTHRFDR